MKRKRFDKYHKKPAPLPPYVHFNGKTGHPKIAIPKPSDDPLAIVTCPYCMVSVIAARRRYWDAADSDLPLLEHAHQPARYETVRTPRRH